MKILFLATEDWFFRSHFLPLLRAARDGGHEAVLAARSSGALDGVEGLRVIDTPFSRRSLTPWDVGAQVARLKSILDAERPDIVHAIALKPIALFLLTPATGFGRVLALTGRGYLAVGRAPWTRLVRWRFRRLLRRALDAPRTVLLVENQPDREWVEGGRPLADSSVVLMPGAGVDITTFTPQPEPGAGPILVGIVARLIRSKGIDLAVEAVRQLRAGGLDITLRIAGDADPQNPEHVSDATIAEWRGMEGVELLGRITNIPAFWARTHVACLPSRGGEGLPRALLEAAACGRPIVTSQTPGCADFIADSGGGIATPADDVGALAEALAKLARNAELRRALGAKARARVEAGYTEAHAGACAVEAWRRLRGVN